MAEYASNAKANTGVSLGAVGTGLGVAALLGANGNGGLLNGILGGNNCNQAIAERDAIIGRLQAEKYTDTAVLSLRDKLEKLVDDAAAQTVKNDKAIAQNAQEIACLQRQLDTEAKWSRENAQLREQILEGKIAAVATAATNGINTLGASLTALQNTVAGITSVVIPKSAICPEVMPRYNSWTAPTTTTSGS